MTAPIREQILSALVSQLGNISGITGLSIDRNKNAQVQKFPALIVLDGDQTSDPGTAYGNTLYSMNVNVEGYVQSSSAAATGTDLNMLYGQVVQTIMQDVTLGGICIDIIEGEMLTNIDRSEGQQPVAAFSVTFAVKYFTASGDPFHF